MRLTLIAAALLIAAPATAQNAPKDPAPNSEIGYPEGALGYGALMKGDLTTAELQLKMSTADANDPAVLINLGQVYAQAGRTKEAEAALRKAIEQEPVELVLSSGRVIDSREAASIALRRVSALASR